MNVNIIDASKARENFFAILDRVFMENESYIVKKSGITVAEIIKPKKEKKKDILSFAGIWKDINSKKLIDYIYEGRRDKVKTRRILPKISSYVSS